MLTQAKFLFLRLERRGEDMAGEEKREEKRTRGCRRVFFGCPILDKHPFRLWHRLWLRAILPSCFRYPNPNRA